jgi:hypothetical protein
MADHDRSTYEKDLALLIKNQTDIIKQQVLLEIITIACNCDDFEQFKKVLYARALGMMKQFEDQGMLKPGTTEKAAKGESIETEKIGK